MGLMTCRRAPQSEADTMWHARVLLCAIAVGLVAAATVPAQAPSASESVPAKTTSASASVPAKAASASEAVPAKTTSASASVPAKAASASESVPAKAPSASASVPAKAPSASTSASVPAKAPSAIASVPAKTPSASASASVPAKASSATASVPAKAPPASASVPAKAPSASAPCDASKCDQLAAKYYEEIHCKPIVEKDACCPTRFDCPTTSAARAEDKCHVAGVTYSAGANISDALSGPCTHACVCKEFADKVNVHCLTTECEEVPDGCVPLFKGNECCAHAFKCDNNSSQKVPPKKEVTCQFEGRGFLEGERLPTPSHPCLDCVCQKGFNGSLTGPWCRGRRCDLELRFGHFLLRGCAPVFHGNKECCPASWRCPSPSDKVIPAKSKAPASASQKDGSCVFGELRLAMGDELTPTSEDEQCACRIPPAVTCHRREVAFDLDLIDPQ